MTSNPEMVEIVAKAILFQDDGWDFSPRQSTPEEKWRSAADSGIHRDYKDMAHAALQALAPLYVERPVWSDTKPDKPGWYWLKCGGSEYMVEVQERITFDTLADGEKLLTVSFSGGQVKPLRDFPVCQWAPCPAPMED